MDLPGSDEHWLNNQTSHNFSCLSKAFTLIINAIRPASRKDKHTFVKTVPHLRSWLKQNYAVMLPLYWLSRPEENVIICRQSKRPIRGGKIMTSLPQKFLRLFCLFQQIFSQVCQEILQYMKQEKSLKCMSWKTNGQLNDWVNRFQAPVDLLGFFFFFFHVISSLLGQSCFPLSISLSA